MWTPELMHVKNHIKIYWRRWNKNPNMPWGSGSILGRSSSSTLAESVVCRSWTSYSHRQSSSKVSGVHHKQSKLNIFWSLSFILEIISIAHQIYTKKFCQGSTRVTEWLSIESRMRGLFDHNFIRLENEYINLLHVSIWDLMHVSTYQY